MFANIEHTLSSIAIINILISFFGTIRIYIVNTQVGLEQLDPRPEIPIISLYFSTSQCPEDIIPTANLNLSSQGKGDSAVSLIW